MTHAKTLSLFLSLTHTLSLSVCLIPLSLFLISLYLPLCGWYVSACEYARLRGRIVSKCEYLCVCVCVRVCVCVCVATCVCVRLLHLFLCVLFGSEYCYITAAPLAGKAVLMC